MRWDRDAIEVRGDHHVIELEPGLVPEGRGVVVATREMAEHQTARPGHAGQAPGLLGGHVPVFDREVLVGDRKVDSQTSTSAPVGEFDRGITPGRVHHVGDDLARSEFAHLLDPHRATLVDDRALAAEAADRGTPDPECFEPVGQEPSAVRFFHPIPERLDPVGQAPAADREHLVLMDDSRPVERTGVDGKSSWPAEANRSRSKYSSPERG